VKGHRYALGALLGDDALAARFDGGSYATFYLSPRDYHRFHTPCALRVIEARYIPGALWPVNRIGLEGIPQLYAENERIVALMAPEVDFGSGCLCIAAVGATMVGKVKVRFDTLTTNQSGARPVHRVYPDGGTRFDKGEEWGHFEFGSTLVMVATPGLLELESAGSGTVLRLGERIGRLLRPRV
jgi:phosphatidylserine decarboxylase